MFYYDVATEFCLTVGCPFPRLFKLLSKALVHH